MIREIMKRYKTRNEEINKYIQLLENNAKLIATNKQWKEDGGKLPRHCWLMV